MFRPWLAIIALAFAGIACNDTSSTPDSGAGRQGGAGTGGAKTGSGGAAGSTTSGGGETAGGAGTAGGTTATTSGGSSSKGGAAGTTTGGGTAGTTSAGGAGGTTAAGGTTGSTAIADPAVLIGWATQGSGTTGGGNATPVKVTTMGQLNSEAGGSAPKVIHVAAGTYSGTLSVGSNKTIIGEVGATIKSSGTLRLSGSKNVIIKNMRFEGSDSGGDNLLFTGAQNVWLDHCEMIDGADGLLDIVGASDFLTISWNIIRYTGKTGHQNAILMAPSNGDSAGKGRLSTTFHHNWWKENICERQPRVRFGKVHVLNNLYTATPGFTYYAVRCGYDANILSENNIYKDFKGISPYQMGEKKGECLAFNYGDGSAKSVLETRGDSFINCTERALDGDGTEGGTFGNGTAFVPPYQYTADPIADLEARIRAGAGPQPGIK